MGPKVRVMQVIPSLELGGAEIMLENLSIALDSNCFDVSVVSLYNKQSAITERLERRKIPIIFLGKKKGFDIKLIIFLCKLFREMKPDVIHTHLFTLPYAIPAAALARVKIRFHTVHNIAKKEESKIRRKINSFFYKYMKVTPVSISPLVRKSVIEEYHLLESKVPMIYNGIYLENCITKNDYQEKDGIINILHIGRFSEQKNHFGLLQSFKLVHDTVPNTILNLIGTGELESTIKDKVKDLNLEGSVKFLGRISNVYPYLGGADIFVLPSLWEGMPISLIEAMGTGLPIVATNVGGVPDMIKQNQTGLLVDTDQKQIAEALLKLINDRNLRGKLGTAAKKASNQFSVQKMANKYENIYLGN